MACSPEVSPVGRGVVLLTAMQPRVRTLNLTLVVTSSQWSDLSKGVTCENFGGLKTIWAAAFLMSCSGSTAQTGRVLRREMQQSRHELTIFWMSSWVEHVVRYSQILLMLYR